MQFVAIANDLKKAKQEAQLQRKLSKKHVYFQKCEEIIQLKSSIIKVSIYTSKSVYFICISLS